MCLLIFCNFSFWFLLLLLLVFCYLKWSTRKIHCFIMIFYVRNEIFFWLWKKKTKKFPGNLINFFCVDIFYRNKMLFFLPFIFFVACHFFLSFFIYCTILFGKKIKIKMVHSFACHNGIDNHNNNKKTFQRFWRKFRKLFFWDDKIKQQKIIIIIIITESR